MPPDPATLAPLLDQLEAWHGRPPRPLPRRALEWVLWENAAYLVPDERRARAYRALEQRTGLDAAALLAVPRAELEELAALGGMQPGRRAGKWIAIAETVRDEFEGDLESALALPLARARRALRRFPGIGAPGADKILLFTGTRAVPALESNGLRVLVRLGHVCEAGSYSSMYRAATAVLAPLGGDVDPAGEPASARERRAACARLVRAYELLRRHGQDPCKNNAPACETCPLEECCPAAS